MNKKKVFLVVVIVVAVIIAVCAWLLASNRVTVSWHGWKPANQTSRVCGAETVSTYNQAMYVTKRKGYKDESIDLKAVNNLAKDIQGRAGYKNDPTCQTILFWTAVQHGDYNAASQAYDVLARLNDENKFPDNNLRNGGALFQYGNIVDSMAPAKQAGEGGSGSK